MTSSRRVCKECDGASKRPAPHPGPRCVTHHRERRKRTREAAWVAHILKTYGLTKEQYDALYEAQGGTCYICQVATGKTRKLSVDHDHASGYVRGLLCRPCNTLLGQFRDDPASFLRGAAYLVRPPAFEVIGKVKP